MKNAQLRAEITRGDRAKSAYEGYVKEFIELKKADIYEAFSNAKISDDTIILDMKKLFEALKGLEISIISDIETGKLATKQLEDLEK